jgi:hypothetical protein
MVSPSLCRISCLLMDRYNIFVINTIFHMQFDQRLLIDEMDPLINTA